MKRLWIRGGRIVDPGLDIDALGDLLIVGGKVADVRLQGQATAPREMADAGGDEIVNATGCVVCPGFVDLHCHLREPGQEDKEDIWTGTMAAARGGFTTVCAMGNTRPPTDSASAIAYLKRAAAERGSVRVLPIANVTRGMAGAELTEMGELAHAGAIGFSDDGKPVASSQMMRHALEYSSMFSRPIIEHSEDPELAKGGSMNESAVSMRLGIPGMPPAAEVVMVARDIALAEMTGGWLHVAHVSVADSVELIRQARQRGVHVTTEATPHHLVLTQDWVAGERGRWADGAPYDTNTKVNPPLRSLADARALVAGLLDGTIDAIATDHAPHTLVDKECEYGYAAFGISGFETALGLLMELVHQGELDIPLLVSKLTSGPARAFGISAGSLAKGSPADVTVFDPTREWIVEPGSLVSKGLNTPLMGLDLRGKVVSTFVGGKQVYAAEGYEAMVAAGLEAR